MRAEAKRTLKIFVSFFLVYALFLSWLEGQHAIFDFAKALVDEQRLSIDSYADNNVDRLLIKGHYYSNKPIGAALLAVPSYVLWKGIYTLAFPTSFRAHDLGSTTKFPSQWYPSVSVYDRISLFERLGRVFVTLGSSALLGLLTVFLVHRFTGLLGASDQDRLLLAIAFGFGTIVFYTATNLFQDTMGMFFSFWGFYLLFRAKETRHRNLVWWAGVVTGFSVAVSYWNILVVPAYLTYLAMAKNIRKILVFLVGSFVGVMPQLLYQYVLTGNPWSPVFIYHDPEIWITPIKHTLGFEFQPAALLYILPQVLFFPTRGLFFYCPILLLALVGIPPMFKLYRAEVIAISMVFVLFVLANTFLQSWWIGGFGCRYILYLIPFLMLPLVYAVRKRRWLFLALLLYSSLVNLSSTAMDAHARLPIPDAQSEYINNFQLAKVGAINNLVYDYGLPQLLKNGPRSRMLESFSHDQDAFDLRSEHESVMGFTPQGAIPLFVHHPVGFISLKTKRLSVFLLVVVFSILWSRELSECVRKRLERPT